MKHNLTSLRKQAGFTLVEIAIVLVIIGLLLGGVLKGQEMIENARIKAVVGDMNGIATAYTSYVDRYRAVPGDEPAATMTNRGWLGTIGGNNNGRLDVAPGATFTNVAVDQASMWRALRGSGLTSGDPAAPAGAGSLPKTSGGGLMGVSVSPYGLPGVAICVSGLTAQQAAGIEAAIDGTAATGSGNQTGSVRGAQGTAIPVVPVPGVPPAANFSETVAGTWTMCRSM